MEHTESLVLDEDVRSNEEERENSSPRHSKISITIEPAIFAIFFSANLCEVVITNLIMARICEVELDFNKTACSSLGSYTDEGRRIEALIQPYTSLLLTAKNLISLIVPAFLSLFLGPWSDYNGRKLLLLLPMLGLVTSFLIYATISYFSRLKPAYFLVASVPFALSGGYINLVSAAYSYISDISSDENRAARLGLLEGSLYIGVLGGMLSSYRVYNLDEQYGYIITLSAGALISLTAFMYTALCVRESISPDEETQNERGLFKLTFLKETFETVLKRRENNGRIIIFLTLSAMIISMTVVEGLSNLMYLFVRLKFGWNLSQFTNWCAVSIVVNVLGLMFGCGILTKFFNVPDAVLVLVSFLSKIAESLAYSLIPANKSILMYWMQLVVFMGGIAGPGLRSVVSKMVPKEDVGKVFSMATSLESLFPLAFSPIFTLIYNKTINSLPGAIFLLSASFYFINILLCSFIYFLQRKNTEYHLLQETNIQPNEMT